MFVLPFHHATNLAFQPAFSHSEQEQPAGWHGLRRSGHPVDALRVRDEQRRLGPSSHPRAGVSAGLAVAQGSDKRQGQKAGTKAAHDQKQVVNDQTQAENGTKKRQRQRQRERQRTIMNRQRDRQATTAASHLSRRQDEQAGDRIPVEHGDGPTELSALVAATGGRSEAERVSAGWSGQSRADEEPVRRKWVLVRTAR